MFCCRMKKNNPRVIVHIICNHDKEKLMTYGVNYASNYLFCCRVLTHELCFESCSNIERKESEGELGKYIMLSHLLQVVWVVEYVLHNPFLRLFELSNFSQLCVLFFQKAVKLLLGLG